MLTTKKSNDASATVCVSTPRPRLRLRASALALFAGAWLLSGCTDPGPRALVEGEELLRERKYADAVVKLEEAADRLPQNPQAWNHLGLAYHYSGQHDKADAAYQRALKLDRNLIAARYNLGWLRFEQGNYSAAANDFTTSVTLDPRNQEAWLKLATSQLRHALTLSGADRTRWLDVARRNFENVWTLWKNPEACNGIGLIEAYRNRPREAIRWFNQAAQQPPGYPAATLNLAIVYHTALDDRRAALQKYREFLASQPRSSRFREIEEIAKRLDAELAPPPVAAATPAPAPVTTSTPVPPAATIAARPVTNREVRTEPEAPRPTHAPRGETRAPAKPETPSPTATAAAAPEPTSRPEPAATPSTAAPSAAPAPATTEPVIARPAEPATTVAGQTNRKTVLQRVNPANWLRGRTNQSAERVEVSKPAPSESRTQPASAGPAATRTTRTITRYTYISPARPQAGNRAAALPHYELGSAAQASRDWPRALAAFEQAIKADPAFFEAHFKLGYAALESGKIARSLSAYETALVLLPDSDRARYNFALALARAKYYLDAANELESVVTQKPAEVHYRLTLANLLANQLGQPSKAREHYLKVLELDPRHPEATDIRLWLARHP